MDLKTLNFKIKDNVAIIELNRPKQYNSLNQVMAEDLFKVSLLSLFFSYHTFFQLNALVK